MICGLLCLPVSFSMFSRFINVLVHFMAKQYCIVWICHILFIHSLVGGHLDCFHFLAIMDFPVLLGIYLVVELLGPLVILCLTI